MHFSYKDDCCVDDFGPAKHPNLTRKEVPDQSQLARVDEGIGKRVSGTLTQQEHFRLDKRENHVELASSLILHQSDLKNLPVNDAC